MRRFTLTFIVFLAMMALAAQEIPLRQAYNLGWERKQIRTLDGCEIVFWSDAPAGNRDVFAQKLAPNGQPVWNEPLPIIDGSPDQRLLSVVPASDNNIILLWVEYEINTTLAIRMQKITSNGQRLWGDDGVQVDLGEGEQRGIYAVPNGTGGAFLIYSFYGVPDIVYGQNIDAFGNQLWSLGGIEIYNDPPASEIYYYNLVSDGEGGMIINLLKYQNSQGNHHLLRISPQGTIVGNNPLLPYSAFPGNNYTLMQGMEGQFILYNRASLNSIRFLKIDNQGNLLMPQSALYSPFACDIMDQYSLQNTPAGGTVLSWLNTYGDNGSYRVQSFDAGFNPLWQPQGAPITPESLNPPSEVYVDVADNGNVWASWMEPNIETHTNDCKAQLVVAPGVPAWQSGGITLGTGGSNPLPLAYPDRGMFAWIAEMDGNTSIRRQVISTGGALFLADGGEPLVESPAGQASIEECVALDGRFLTIWTDTRGNGSIYYQISDMEMQPLLELNGRILNVQEAGQISLVDAQSTPQNTCALLYKLSQTEQYAVWYQEINQNGDPVYPGNGIQMFSSASYNADMYMGFDSASTYLGYVYTEDYSSYEIRGQRLFNGQKMWGENGRTITTLPGNSLTSMESVTGSYFLWRIESYDYNTISCNVLKVNQNGEPAAGWNPTGMSIVTDEGSAYNQSLLDCGLVGDDLVAFVLMHQFPESSTQAQRISSSGERLWQDAGVSIGEETHVMDAVYDEVTTFLMFSLDDLGAEQLSLQMIGSGGTLYLSPEGVLIASGLHNVYDANLVKFFDGTYLCVWSDDDGAWISNRDVYIRQVDPNGFPLGDAPEVYCSARYQQHYLRTAVIDNQAFIAWNDDRAGILNSEVAITGIWANSLISTWSDLDDQELPQPAGLTLYQNCPNPFNPQTTISFSLSTEQKIDLNIYNIRGQLVASLYQDALLPAGEHSVLWNAKDASGRDLCSGVYLIRLSDGEKNSVRKMLLSK
jgi:hypothetical protein